MKRLIIVSVFYLLITLPAPAAELVRVVRFKISAGDLPSAIAAAEDYRSATGVDAEYLDAVGWLARGAEYLRRPDLARQFVEQLHRDIPSEAEATLIPYGAAIEIEGRLIASAEGRGAAIRYLEQAYSKAQATSLRSRIRKNINMLSLEGQSALPIEGRNLERKPTLLFFWMAGCGDCKAQAPALQRVWSKYKSRGLQMVTVTRLYGGSHDKPLTPEAENAEIQKFWTETYPDLSGVPVVVSTDTMVRYGVSATPTFALVDERGLVRLYTPTRLSEAELSRRIEDVLREVRSE
jgi:hypothetical protein